MYQYILFSFFNHLLLQIQANVNLWENTRVGIHQCIETLWRQGCESVEKLAEKLKRLTLHGVSEPSTA